MKTKNSLMLLVAALSALSLHADDWQKVAFVGEAKVKTISGLVEVMAPETRILREGENAQAGEILRVWRGAELILQMKSSQGLIRAKGPALVRLIPDSQNDIRISVAKSGYVTRALRGGARYSEDGVHWHDLKEGVILADGSKVRPFRDSAVILYHNEAKVALQVTDHKKATTLAVQGASNPTGLFAAQAP